MNEKITIKTKLNNKDQFCHLFNTADTTKPSFTPSSNLINSKYVFTIKSHTARPNN